MWEFVRGTFTDPMRLVAGLERMHDKEDRFVDGASLEEEKASWLKRISQRECKEECLLDLRLEGDITTEQFRTKSAALQEGQRGRRGQPGSRAFSVAPRGLRVRQGGVARIPRSPPKTSTVSPPSKGEPSTG